MKKYLIIATLVGCVIFAVNVFAFNFQLFDTNWVFNKAQIRMMDGSCISGTIETWRDYEDSDVVQVKIDGVVYVTSYENVVLIYDEGKK